MLNWIKVIVPLFVFATGFAQQVAIHNQYFTNNYGLNPATAGENGTRLFLDYRKQWAGLQGAPETQLMTLDGPLKNKNMGLGVLVQNDNYNIFGHVKGALSYAYQLNITERQNVRFGLTAGIMQQRILFDQVYVDDLTEDILFSNRLTNSSFEAGAGFQYTLGTFKLGLVLDQLVGNQFNYADDYIEHYLLYRLVSHYTATAGVDIPFEQKKFIVTPFLLYRTVSGAFGQFDGNLKFSVQNKVWLNLAYRHEIGYAATLGSKINDKIYIGYTYEMSSTSLNNVSSGTHEFLIGFEFGKNEEEKEDGLSPEQLEELKKRDLKILEKQDLLEQKIEQNQKDLEAEKRRVDEFIDGLEEWKESVKLDEEALKKFIEENALNIKRAEESNQTVEEVINDKEPKDSEDERPTEDRKSEPKESKISGNKSSKSFQIANDPTAKPDSVLNKFYVVVGACRKFDKAKEFQKIVEREYEYNTVVVQNDKQTWYLISTLATDNKQEAIEEFKRVRNYDPRGIFVGRPWVYGAP